MAAVDIQSDSKARLMIRLVFSRHPVAGKKHLTSACFPSDLIVCWRHESLDFQLTNSSELLRLKNGSSI